MGCCSGLPDHPGEKAISTSSGRPVEVETADGVQKVLIAPASYCYCLLISSAATFVDVRTKDAFSKNHLFGAWSLHSLVTRFPEGREATNALKSLCDLRRVVVISENPLEDENVKKLLLLLKQTVRPSQLLLMDDLHRFQQRFPFCMRQGSETLPLPPCPSELVEPGGWKPPALYLGSVACLEERNEALLRCFKIGVVVQVVDEDHGRRWPRHLKLQRVQLGKVDCLEIEGASESEKEERTWQLAAKVAAAAWEACERTLAQRVPCFLCGPWSMVVAALCLKKIFTSLRTTEELCVFLKDRCPSMALPPVAVLALNLALDGPKSTTSVVSAKDLACRIRHRLGMEAEVPLKTVRVVLEKVLAQPTEERLRRLKASNVRVQRELLAHPEAVALLQLAGFTSNNGDLVLSSGAALAPLREVLQSL